jgi:hypothetical protein
MERDQAKKQVLNDFEKGIQYLAMESLPYFEGC